MLIHFENKQIEVEKIYDQGWEGIIVLDATTNQYYLCDLMWQGGGYVERVKKISAQEYVTFKDLGKAE
jgi:hypothetical protein